MKFVIENSFDAITCAEYEALYFDEPFTIELAKVLQLGRQLQRLDRTPDRIVRHICYDAKHDPDTPAGKAFGTSRASFVEEMEYDLAEHRGHWRTIPNMMPDRVRNAGTIEVIATPTGVRHVVRGEVKASLFGFGGIVERMIVGEIEKSYARAAPLTRDWIAKRRS